MIARGRFTWTRAMNISAPCTFDDIEHVWIEMPDGIRLAARIWLPHEAAKTPGPAILEIIPYRKGDMVRARDERNHPYFAANGYACLRVDMRGSGDSEGLMGDMYEPNELSDTRHVLDWIAEQPWCNGRVGMFGTSWGGTASLQASLDAPECLKAVIAVCATHDRYEDDIHHMGGCLLTDTIEWGATLPAILASPPCAETVGANWRQMWQERLDNLAFPLETWVREEARGTYWRSGSVRFDSGRIKCPILGIGGWSDRYSNSVMSLVQARPDTVWGIVGPWSHHYPDVGHPGPGMNFQHVALAWWDHWLKDAGEAPLEWPKLRVWMREFDPPQDALERRNGHWVESYAPQEERSSFHLHLANGKLTETEPSGVASADSVIPHDLRVGQCSGDTGYFGRFGGLPLDQGADDVHSLVYDTEELVEDMVLFGAAEFVFNVRSSTPAAQISLRISDVAPDGSVCRVVMAMRNLALDDMLDERSGTPSCNHRVRVRFPTNAYRFGAGHKIRLALATSYWPLVWPSPEVSNLYLQETGAVLTMPTNSKDLVASKCNLPEPSSAATQARHAVVESKRIQRITEETEDGTVISSWHQPPVRVLHHDTQSTFGFQTRAEHEICGQNPLSAQSRFDHILEYERPDGTARVLSWAAVRCDEEHFHVSGRVTVFWNNEQIFTRSWAPSIKRRVS